MCWRLRPDVLEAAALCAGGCGPMPSARLRELGEHGRLREQGLRRRAEDLRRLGLRIRVMVSSWSGSGSGSGCEAEWWRLARAREGLGHALALKAASGEPTCQLA